MRSPATAPSWEAKTASQRHQLQRSYSLLRTPRFENKAKLLQHIFSTTTGAHKRHSKKRTAIICLNTITTFGAATHSTCTCVCIGNIITFLFKETRHRCNNSTRNMTYIKGSHIYMWSTVHYSDTNLMHSEVNVVHIKGR